MKIDVSFTPEREAELQKECDLYNAANPDSTFTLAQFCQAIAQDTLNVRADSAIARAAVPPTRAELDQVTLDNARLAAENAALKAAAAEAVAK
jgi:hypothetical protein